MWETRARPTTPPYLNFTADLTRSPQVLFYKMLSTLLNAHSKTNSEFSFDKLATILDGSNCSLKRLSSKETVVKVNKLQMLLC